MKRRPESTAALIAAQLAADARPGRRTRVREMPGAVVAEYLIDQRTQRNPTAPPRAITAAAQILAGPTVARTNAKSTKQKWQDEVWQLRDDIGEFRFSGDRIARSVSLMRPIIAKVESLGDEPVEVADGLPAELGLRMFSDPSATSQRLFRAAQHVVFNGETLPIIRDIDDGRFEWEPCSVQELTPAGKNWQYNDGLDTRRLDPTEHVVRAWIPAPMQRAWADCGARAILPVARELRGLTEHVSAQIDSRLAGAGVLLVPQEIETLRGQGSPTPEDADDDLDPFIRDLMEMMLTPIKDRSSAAALVPLVAKVPGALVDKIKHLKFSEPLDPKAQELRAEAIRRIALGMDSPPEVLLGLGSGSNHWSAWAIGEEDVKLAVAPVAVVILHALTTGWLHPLLQAEGVTDWQNYLVWFDASALRLRPDRSSDARDLFDRGALSREAMLRENGFGDTDLPDDQQARENLLTKLLVGAPSLAPLLLPMLGIEVDASVLNKTSAIAEATDGAAPDTPADDQPTPPPDDDTGDRQRALPEGPGSPGDRPDQEPTP
ncbi:hypothetical protein [Nocardia sp. CC201C]|uniref:hypothetical protein n=1 Tax=Nocardia sp. CC201C TaxID=3044575 RepID=UPI0024A9FCD8|nr:hypothetical protein [Nocardia sp. CC201C]